MHTNESLPCKMRPYVTNYEKVSIVIGILDNHLNTYEYSPLMTLVMRVAKWALQYVLDEM